MAQFVDFVLGGLVIVGIGGGIYWLYTQGFFSEKYDPQKTDLFPGGKEPPDLRGSIKRYVDDISDIISKSKPG